NEAENVATGGEDDIAVGIDRNLAIIGAVVRVNACADAGLQIDGIDAVGAGEDQGVLAREKNPMNAPLREIERAKEDASDIDFAKPALAGDKQRAVRRGADGADPLGDRFI